MNFFKNKRFKNFIQMEKEISLIQDTTLKGDIFEEFNRLYFEFYKERYNLKNVWIGKSSGHQVPHSVKDKLGLSQNDMGSDGLVETLEGKYYVIQTKFRSDRSSATYTELTNATYESRKCEGLYIFTNSSRIPSKFDGDKDVLKILFNDLVKLEDYFFEKIHEIANNQEVILVKKHTPRIYQQRAIDKIMKGFKASDRGQYIAACGSGKTYTALWLKEEMKANKTLVMLPSIYLVKQTLEQWIDQRSDKFAFCCICSDGDINNINNNDAFDSTDDFIDIDSSELGIKVTTDKDELINFFEINNNKPTVIFSTYQSSKVVSDAVKQNKIKFDLMICDEAHKTSGVEKRVFSNVLNDKFIDSSKRLFLTATPKVLSQSSKITADNLSFEYHSMDDERIYGPEFDTFSFAEAIQEKAIVDYEILITGINDADILDFKSLNNNSLIDGNRGVQNKDIAITIAVEKLMSDKDYEIDKALNFSKTIKRSEEFIENINIPGINQSSFGVAASISSNQTSKERAEIMHEFIESDKAILSNARCLTEGVDVPGVDAVIFSDKKQSPIDIVQAVGRALRKNERKPNKVARIFIPIFLDENSNKIDLKKYKYVFEIIESLRMHDKTLSAVIDDLHGALIGVSTDTRTNKIKIKSFKNADIKKLKEILVPQVARLNGQVFKDLDLKYSGHKTTTPKTEFRIAGRYNFENNNFGSLFKIEDFKTLSVKDFIKYNPNDNNFKSHARRLGLIETKQHGYVRLTSYGDRFANGEPLKNIASEHFDKMNDIDWHPYVIVKEILNQVKEIDDFGWMYGLNIIKTNTDRNSYIKDAVDRIQFINSKNFKYKLIIENYSNCVRVIDFLNDKFKNQLDLFGFIYDPDLHIYRSGLRAELGYLGNHMSSCWPEKYSYSKDKRILSVK